MRGHRDERVWLDSGRPNPLERLDEATVALEALREVFALAEPLGVVLDRVAAGAVQAVHDADGVTITVVTEDGVRTEAATEDRLVEVDQAQYAADRGPCLQAARAREAVRAVVGEHRDLWPEFEDAARRLDVCAYLSVPMLVTGADGDRLVGSLNVHSATAGAFDPFDESVMRLFTTAASAAITNTGLWQDARVRVAQLETALYSRAEIDQAKGVLMGQHGFGADEAFAMLVQRSQHTNTKLREVAREVLASAKAT